MAHLPGAVNLVAQRPVLDVIRLLAAVLATLISPVGVARLVAVLDPVASVVNRAQTGINANVGLGANSFAITQELIHAETITLQIVPCQVDAHRALVLWSDSILPVVARGKIASRPAQYRNPQLLDRLHYVLAITVCI